MPASKYSNIQVQDEAIRESQKGVNDGVAELDSNGKVPESQLPPSDTYEAIVDAGGDGDYLLPSAAFADNKTVVFVKNGTYIETADIEIPDGGRIIGESAAGVQIVLGANQVKADGSGATKQTGGTISINNGSTSVVGIGTSFNSLPDPSLNEVYILLGIKYYQVVSISDDLNLEIDTEYEGESLIGESYIAQQMISGLSIENLILANSTTVGLSLKGVFNVKIASMLVINSTGNNIDVSDSAFIHFFGMISQDSAANGVSLTDCYSVIIETSSFNNNSGIGMNVDGDSEGIVFDGCYSINNTGDGISINGTTTNVNITDSISDRNQAKGVDVAAGVGSVIIDSCTITGNGADGVDFDGSECVASNNVIRGNGGDGIQAGDNGVITGNHVENNAGDGIELTGDNECSVTGNIIHGNTIGISMNQSNNTIACNIIYDNSSHGINMTGSSDDNVINGNRVTGNGGDGIRVAVAGATDNIVTSNNAKTNTGASITDNGTGTIVANNQT